MSDEVERDHALGAALRELRVPEHSPEFFAALRSSLEEERRTQVQEKDRRPHRPFGRGGIWLRRLVPAGAVLAVLAGLLVWNVTRPPSALAVVEDAIESFEEIPPFRAIIEGPRGEVQFARLQLLYRGRDAWRIELLAPPPTGFELWDGERYYTYSSRDNSYSSSTNIGEGFSPLGLLAWESHGGIAFWRERCGKAASRVLGNDVAAGRTAHRVRCADLELWIDAETGLIVRITSHEPPSALPRPVPGPIGLFPGATVEITEIEYNPTFPEGAFEFVPPPGAREAPPVPEPEPPSERLRPGDRAPDWSGELLDGGTFDTSSLRGRPAAVLFWAHWCEPCIETPTLQFQRGFQKHAAAIGFVSVSYDKHDPTQDVVDLQGLRFPVVLDEQGRIPRTWGLRGIPSLVLLDAGGRVRGFYLGPLSDEDFDRLFEDFAAGRPLPEVSPRL